VVTSRTREADAARLAEILADIASEAVCVAPGCNGPVELEHLDSLLMQEELERLRQAETRLKLARQVLIEDGYFSESEVGDDLAPRLVEWLAHHRYGAGRPEEANLPEDPAEIAGIPVLPDALLDFIELCITGSEHSIRSHEPVGAFISRAAYDAGVDLFAVWDDCTSKRKILANYRGAKSRAKAWEALHAEDPEDAGNLDEIRGHLTGAHHALVAVAWTFRDRYGFGRAMRGAKAAEPAQ
jgi:hypothetical protein